MLMSRQPGRMRGGRNNKTQPESKSAKLTRLDEYIKKRGAGVGDAAGVGLGSGGVARARRAP